MELERRTKKEIVDIKSIKLKKLKIKFDITTLDMIIAFIYKDSVLRTRKTLTNIKKLFDNIDPLMYEDNPYLKDRVWIIQKTLYCRLVEGFESSPNFVMQYCKDDLECTELAKEIIDNSNSDYVFLLENDLPDNYS